MPADRATLARTAAGIRADIGAVERILGVLDGCGSRFAARDPDAIELHGVGGYLHDFYSAVENGLARVVPALNGALPSGPAWHRALLDATTLDVAGVRPPVLSRRAARSLEPYLRFRHRYRQMYAYDLEWGPISALVGGTRLCWRLVRADLDRFLGFLDAAAEALDEA
ncbi:MAG: hypothetical protein QME96_06995 [Myxococcota bacterium]|nr:hypothetical protein [Myxococcota bacterium]